MQKYIDTNSLLFDAKPPILSRKFNERDFECVNEHEMKYDSVEGMINVKGSEIVKARIEFLKELDKEIAKRLEIISAECDQD